MLQGGRGNDWLMGGGGADVFLWKSEDLDGGTDYVLDFSTTDKLDITSVLSGYEASDPVANWIKLENNLTVSNPFNFGAYSRLLIDMNGLSDFTNPDQTIIFRNNALVQYADAQSAMNAHIIL